MMHFEPEIEQNITVCKYKKKKVEPHKLQVGMLQKKNIPLNTERHKNALWA